MPADRAAALPSGVPDDSLLAVRTNSPGALILETTRLGLRELVPADLDFLAVMLADPEVMRYYPQPLTRHEAERWLERQRVRYATDGHGLWLVTERRTGAPVGQVGLLMQRVDAFDGVPQPEIGYLLHRPFWGRGYATEAALEVRHYAFTRCAYPAVIALVRPGNRASRGVARRLGMEVLTETSFSGYPHLVYSITAAQLAQRQADTETTVPTPGM